jgi:hypothetical protein
VLRILMLPGYTQNAVSESLVLLCVREESEARSDPVLVPSVLSESSEFAPLGVNSAA